MCQRKGCLGVKGTIALREWCLAAVPSWAPCSSASGRKQARLPPWCSPRRCWLGQPYLPRSPLPLPALISVPPSPSPVLFPPSFQKSSKRPPAQGALVWPGGRGHSQLSTMLSRGGASQGCPGWRGDTCCLACSEFLGLLCRCSERSRVSRACEGFLLLLEGAWDSFVLVSYKVHENGSLQSSLFLSWFPSVLSKSFLYLAFRTSRPFKAPCCLHCLASIIASHDSKQRVLT